MTAAPDNTIAEPTGTPEPTGAPDPASAIDPASAPDPASAIDAAIDGLRQTLDRARLRAEAGEAVDLGGLDRRMAGLCAAVVELETGAARTRLPRLTALRDDLDALTAALRQHPPRPDGGIRVATARRAADAYGQTK